MSETNDNMIDSELVCQNPEKHCLSLAVTYCPTCDLCLCQDCEKATHQPKIMKSHQLVSMQNRVPKCQIHPQYPLDKICLFEKVLICAECQYMSYKDQQVQTLEEVATTIRTNLSEKFDINEKRFGAVLAGHDKDALKHAKDVEDSGESLISEVDGIFETLHAKLTSRHEAIKDEIRSAIKTQVDQSTRIHEKVSTARSNLASVRQNFNKQLPSDLGLVTSSSTLEQQLEDLRVELGDMIESQSSFHALELGISELPSMHETIASFAPMQQVNMYEAHKEVQLLAVNDLIDAHINHEQEPDHDEDQFGRYSPLLNACKDDDDSKVKLLIDYGANIELKTDDFVTALNCASFFGHDKCVSLLLDAGAEVKTGKGGRKVLVSAAHSGYVKCVELLLDTGDISEEDRKVALGIARSRNHIKCVELLEKRNQTNNSILALLRCFFLYS
mmetsp:Transcript_39227/g.50675  ORF Transcript_39227/g.50675 Transcript_39227/m.50675 type:complete len:444 (-) Transcript_39227:226-1557(-)